MIVCASPARSYPLQLSIHKANAITHRKSPSRQGREGITLLVVPPCFGQFSGKLTLIKRNNGRSRGNCSVQTPRRPSAYLLRGKLAAYMVFPLSRRTRLLLLLTVPSTVLLVGYSLAGKQQHVKCALSSLGRCQREQPISNYIALEVKRLQTRDCAGINSDLNSRNISTLLLYQYRIGWLTRSMLNSIGDIPLKRDC